MVAMLSIMQLEAGPGFFHEYLRSTSEMKSPPLSACIAGDVCLNYKIYAPTGAFKISGRLHYFVLFTTGNAKALVLIYAPSSNHIRSLPIENTRQKVPSATPIPYFSKAEKNLVVAVLLGDGVRRVS